MNPRPEPCPKCRRNRWRTAIKRLAWRCRACGYLRDARPPVDDLAGDQ